MGEQPQHPITTPKGASVLTVILAVIGVFMPFLASLQAAQLFAILSVFMILWLYVAELREALAKRAGFAPLSLPGVAIVIIAGVAFGASSLVQDRTPPPPAITAKDVTDAVNSALKHNQTEPPPEPASKVPSDPYRIVVQEPLPLRAAPVPAPRVSEPRSAPPASSSSALQDVEREVERATVSSSSRLACIQENIDVSVPLLKLINSAVDTENAYYYGKNDKLIVSKYKQWVADIEKLFADHRSDLPDVVVVRMASQGEGDRTFLGIHDSGHHAWADMEAKRQVLLSIYKDVTNRSCDSAADAALAKCISDKTC